MTIIDFIKDGDNLIWNIFFIAVIPILGILILFLVQRKTLHLPLQKKRKIFLTVVIVLILLLLIQIVSDIDSIQKGYLPLWNYIKSYLSHIFFIAIFSYAFFRKNKEQINEE